MYLALPPFCYLRRCSVRAIILGNLHPLTAGERLVPGRMHPFSHASFVLDVRTQKQKNDCCRAKIIAVCLLCMFPLLKGHKETHKYLIPSTKCNNLFITRCWCFFCAYNCSSFMYCAICHCSVISIILADAICVLFTAELNACIKIRMITNGTLVVGNYVCSLDT